MIGMGLIFPIDFPMISVAFSARMRGPRGRRAVAQGSAASRFTLSGCLTRFASAYSEANGNGSTGHREPNAPAYGDR